MQDLTDLFKIKTHRKTLANITHVDNIPSIMSNGILSHDLAQRTRHESIALESVQDRRHQKRVPNGLRLHQYACLYFSARNPMMYYRVKNPDIARIADLCVLLIDPSILETDGVVVTDGNAASEITRFYPAEEGLMSLNYDMIYAEWWTADNPYEKDERKRVKCAEVLIPNRIPYQMVVGAVVPLRKTEERIRSMGFEKQIIINRKTFFLEGDE